MNGVLAINPHIKFPDNSEQSTKYTNEKNVILQTIYNNNS
jgi:hypothetical protein